MTYDVIARKEQYGIFSEVCFLGESNTEVLDEFTLIKSPLKGFIKKIQDIKNASPNEFSDNEEIKEFIDKNYDDLMKISELLSKEPEDIEKSQIKWLLVTGIGVLINCIGAAVACEFVVIIGMIFMLISSIIACVATYSREKHDKEVLNNLYRVKSRLKSIDKNKLNKEDNSKLSRIFDSIEDAEDLWEEKEANEERAADRRAMMTRYNYNFNY